MNYLDPVWYGPFKTPQIPSDRDHKALNRGTLGGLGGWRYLHMAGMCPEDGERVQASTQKKRCLAQTITVIFSIVPSETQSCRYIYIYSPNHGPLMWAPTLKSVCNRYIPCTRQGPRLLTPPNQARRWKCPNEGPTRKICDCTYWYLDPEGLCTGTALIPDAPRTRCSACFASFSHIRACIPRTYKARQPRNTY